MTMPEAKSISKFYKFFCPFGMLVCAILMWLGIFPNATEYSIVGSWAAMYGVGAGTIDVNLICGKFASNKEGNECIQS